MTEDEMVGWHHNNRHEVQQVPGDGEGQGNLVCCSSWSQKQLDMTERLNDNTLIYVLMDLTFLLLCFLVIFDWMPSNIKFPMHA